MDYKTGRPDHIEDYLVQLHIGQWFGWSDSKNKVYANIILHPKCYIDGGSYVDNPHSKPTEQECIDGLAQLQTDFDNTKTKEETDKVNANQKLKDLGLTDDEIKAIKGIR